VSWRSRQARPSLRRLPDRAASAVVVAALVGINLTDHLLPKPWWVRPVEAGALLLFARLAGLTWSQLGLGRDRLATGGRWAGGAITVVAGIYAVGVLLPLTRPAFQDARYHLPVEDALVTAFVVIPLGTVLLEEIAFRSVLWGLLARHSRPWQVLVATSVLFGFWHVLPSLGLADANPGVSGALGGGGNAPVVVATVAFTAIGGLVFGELRRRSDSVLAAAGAHWATNALGVLFGLLAWRLTR
jgi:membrane protease YdiL (CAAX protease family)